jgi:hypothetical protein
MAVQKPNISTLYKKLGFGNEFPDRKSRKLQVAIQEYWPKFCDEKNISVEHTLSAEEADTFAFQFCNENEQRAENFWPVTFGGANVPSWENDKELYVVSSFSTKHTQLIFLKYPISFGQTHYLAKEKPREKSEK